MILATQKNLPETLRAEFQETLRPELITVLREHLPPLNSTLLEHKELYTTNHDVLTSQLSELSTGVTEIKKQMYGFNIIQTRIASALQGQALRPKHKALPEIRHRKQDDSVSGICLDEDMDASEPSVEMIQESLRDA